MSSFQLFHTVSGRYEAQMLWGSQRMMEGVQKHGGGGGGCGLGDGQWRGRGGGCSAVFHSEHVAAG